MDPPHAKKGKFAELVWKNMIEEQYLVNWCTSHNLQVIKFSGEATGQ